MRSGGFRAASPSHLTRCRCPRAGERICSFARGSARGAHARKAQCSTRHSQRVERTRSATALGPREHQARLQGLSECTAHQTSHGKQGLRQAHRSHGLGSVARELGLVDANDLLPAAYVQPPPTPKAPKAKAPVPPPPPETPTAPKPPPVAIDPPARRPSSRGTRVSPRETRRSSRAEAPPSETKRRRTETPKVDADKEAYGTFRGESVRRSKKEA